ncbi:condensation domain-containing protein, partial [Longimicrobium sp.]|uniref:condensation domain-containing protein n=1 Tax=Longimicrobium sp. TaxID=2029185 RepID=UPI002E35B87F
KGVAVPHRGVVRLARGADYAPLGPGARVAQLSSTAFDAATFEVWGALLNGGTLVVLPPGPLSAGELGAALRAGAVTTLWLTAGLFHRMVDEDLEGLRGLRHLLAGGDVLSPAHVRRVREALPALRLVNGYGPTENTTFTCTHAVVRAPRDGSPVPIGGPVAHTRVFVADVHGAAAPVGVPGELWAGGAGVARGYLGDPALTAARFVPDPFSGRPGARVYRTGDRVRWREDGALEFLGRMDGQVKLRGFRIEPAEVEAALLSYPGVRQARVLAREDTPGERALVAYTVGDADADALRAHLGATLPAYMVPAAFVPLDALPLTPSGKVDARALPAPGYDAGRYVAPRTEVEQVLAGAWAEVLGRERVGVRDSFFELGGHSLLAMRLISRVRAAFGVELPIRAVFAGPTVEAMAAEVERLVYEDVLAAPEPDDAPPAGEAPGTRPPPIARVPRDGPLPLSFAQQRLWFVDRLQPGRAAYNMPFAVRVGGPLSRAALARALAATVGRHESLRTFFPLVDGEPVQRVCPAGPVPLPVVDLGGVPRAHRARQLARIAAAEAARPFDLAARPPLRGLLVRLGPDDHAVLLTLHHIASDGWSMEIFVREISTLYEAFVEGRDPALPDLPVQYADFAAWQRAWLSGPVLEREAGWWRARLAGAPPLLDLPPDRPRPAVARAAAGAVVFDVDAETTERLDALARAEGATLFMALLAAWQALLARWSGQDDVVVGSPIAGRNRLETEGLIGMFVNLLVLRADLAADPPFRALLRQVRDTTVAAYQHQDLPFEKLVEELGVERTLAYTPLFQVLFALQNTRRGDLRLGGARVENLHRGTGTVKFDLSMNLVQDAAGLHGRLSYRAQLWDEPTLAELLRRYARLLEAVAADPGARVSALPLVDAAERARLLADARGEDRPRPAGCIHEAFQAWAARAPHAPA